MVHEYEAPVTLVTQASFLDNDFTSSHSEYHIFLFILKTIPTEKKKSSSHSHVHSHLSVSCLIYLIVALGPNKVHQNEGNFSQPSSLSTSYTPSNQKCLNKCQHAQYMFLFLFWTCSNWTFSLSIIYTNTIID